MDTRPLKQVTARPASIPWDSAEPHPCLCFCSRIALALRASSGRPRTSRTFPQDPPRHTSLRLSPEQRWHLARLAQDARRQRGWVAGGRRDEGRGAPEFSSEESCHCGRGRSSSRCRILVESPQEATKTCGRRRREEGPSAPQQEGSPPAPSRLSRGAHL